MRCKVQYVHLAALDAALMAAEVDEWLERGGTNNRREGKEEGTETGSMSIRISAFCHEDVSAVRARLGGRQSAKDQVFPSLM